MSQEGCGIDVVSGGSCIPPRRCFPAERIYFHGNNKTVAELRMALDYGVGRIVWTILPNCTAVRNCGFHGKTADIYLRITPGIEAHTHDFIKTGQIDSKFGITLENGDALNAVKTATQLIGISLKGLHCHIGSQIFDEQPFIHAAEVMLNFIAQIREQTGVVLNELNLGGGFGVRYTNKDSPKEYGEYMRLVSAVLNEKAEKRNLPVPYIVIEPGRSIVAPAGITLYTVGSIKEIPGIRSYLSIDGGMTDNPRYALYKSPYTAVVANKADRPPTAYIPLPAAAAAETLFRKT